MNGRIIGLEYINGVNKTTKKEYKIISLRWAFPMDGVIGAEVRTDSIRETDDAWRVLSPYLNGRMDALVNMNISVDLIPTGRIYNNVPQMKFSGLVLHDDKRNVSTAK